MLGYPGEPGIMLLTLRDLFSEVANQKSNLHFEPRSCTFYRLSLTTLTKDQMLIPGSLQ